MCIIILGKSTYLDTLGLQVVLAQAGCFVPAKFACFRMLRRLLSIFISILYCSLVLIRSSDDADMLEDLSACCSSFQSEMYAASTMLHTVKNHSKFTLVLSDELGRGTSQVEGLAVAWSICESILRSRAFCVVATHMHELCMLCSSVSQGCPVRLSRLLCERSEKGYTPTFQLQSAECNDEVDVGYGLDMAQAANVPAPLVDFSRETLRGVFICFSISTICNVYLSLYNDSLNFRSCTNNR